MGQITRHDQSSFGTADAADLIANSCNPTLVIDAIDMAGARAAIELAKAAGLKLDHAESAHFAPMQEIGFITTMPGEAVERGDMILWVGSTGDLLKTDETARRLFNNPISVGANAGKKRKQLTIAPHGNHPPDHDDITVLDLGDRPLIETLSMLRARANGRPIAVDGEIQKQIDNAVETLKSAHYGIVAFCAGELSFLEQSHLMGLVDDLSAETRWSLLPLKLAPGQSELTRMTLALTGLVVPLSFHQGRAQHDAKLYGVYETLARGETDLIIWVSASQRTLPRELSNAGKVITITTSTTPPTGVTAHIQIGAAGIDHDGILEAPELGSLVCVSPVKEISDLPTAADALGALATRVNENLKVTA
ncbi:MAG: hypothetical protein ACRBCJ_04620 [Hyphomicrobiaceae bacterium]